MNLTCMLCLAFSIVREGNLSGGINWRVTSPVSRPEVEIFRGVDALFWRSDKAGKSSHTSAVKEDLAKSMEDQSKSDQRRAGGLSPRALTYSEVVQNRTANKHKNFATYESHGKPASDPTSARDRFLAGGPFIAHNEPRFSLKPGASIYTIGSCFARNVEVTLRENGFLVPALDEDFDQAIYVSKPHHPHTVLNKYNAHAMALEINRALGRFAPLDGGLIEIGQEKWFDPQMSFTAPRPRELVLRERAKVDHLTSRLLESDVLILTLGLTETWQDIETGVVFNNGIAAVVASSEWRKRLRLFNARVQEVYDVLADALTALNAAKPDLKVVITVSPVPLTQTFVRQDSIVANTRSKAVLRAAADMLFEDFSFVDYFPSYEMVTNSPREMTWLDDQIHVTQQVVGPVIAQFVKRYASVPPVDGVH